MVKNKKSVFKKGNKPWNKGIPMKESTKKKLGKSLKGKIPWNKNKKTRIRAWNYIDGRSTHQRHGTGRIRGSEHWNWKGGFFPLNKAIRSCFKYHQWQKKCLDRDNHICRDCGVNEELIVHHINYLIFIIRKNHISNIVQALLCGELWDTNNGITLCVKCHSKTHKGEKF